VNILLTRLTEPKKSDIISALHLGNNTHMKLKMILLLSICFSIFSPLNVAATDVSVNNTIDNSSAFVMYTTKDKCDKKDVVGSYTRTATLSDAKVTVFQLNISTGGTVYLYWNGLLERQNTEGTGSPNIGTWKCTKDDQLAFTAIASTYLPTEVNPGTGDFDLELVRTVRFTELYNIDGNKLQRVKRVVKCFLPTEDATDLNAVPGCGSGVNTTPVEYKRLEVIEDDLVTP
jgi:hypothetical protein